MGIEDFTDSEVLDKKWDGKNQCSEWTNFYSDTTQVTPILGEWGWQATSNNRASWIRRFLHNGVAV